MPWTIENMQGFAASLPPAKRSPSPDDTRSLPGKRRLRRARFWLLMGAAWIGGCAFLGFRLFEGHLQDEHAQATADFDRSFSLLSQRLDQNQALLDGLAALLLASQNPVLPQLRSYANEMLARYPHLYTIGHQPLVVHSRRAAFEQQMKRHFARDFQIRDFSFDSDRRWRIAGERPFYYPVIFMAPELSSARDVIGYDIYSDSATRAAIDESSTSSSPVAAPPFELVEGGRGYIFLRVLHQSPLTHKLPVPGDHVISLLVQADRLLLGASVPAHARLQLRHRASSTPLVHREPMAATGPYVLPLALPGWLQLPKLHLVRLHSTAHQPLELDMHLQLRWSDLPWRRWVEAVLLWTLTLTAGVMVARQLQRLRRSAVRSEQKALQLQDELKTSEQRSTVRHQRVLEDVASGIAHELNQPLMAVIGYNQTALRLMTQDGPTSTQGVEEIRRHLQASSQQALRAGELLGKLRQLVRQHSVERSPVTLQNVVLNALQLEQTRLTAAHIQTETHMPSTPVVIVGDATLLEQLVCNLLRNATEALTEANSAHERRIEVHLQMEETAGVCRLSVKDNGPGMNDVQLQQAFHPFQSTKPGGLGIGLVVCDTIAHAHQGHMEAHSVPGNGAQFVLQLPWRESYPAAHPSE